MSFSGERPRGQCVVCGSSGWRLMIRPSGQTVWVCAGHAFVCPAHLLDPCRICDGESDEEAEDALLSWIEAAPPGVTISEVAAALARARQRRDSSAQ